MISVLALLTLVAADKPVKVARMCSIRDDNIYISTPDSLKIQRFRLDPRVRYKYLGYELPGQYMKMTFTDATSLATVTDFEYYYGADADFRTGYLFESAESVGVGKAMSMRLKLTRLLEPVEVTIPAGADAEQMIARARRCKAGDLVMVRCKGPTNSVTEFDRVEQLLRGYVIRPSAHATVDGKKVSGVEIQIGTETKVFAIPPAGRPGRGGDGEIQSFCRKLKKNAPVRFTVDSERPEVINSIEFDIDVRPRDELEADIRLPGLLVHVRRYQGSSAAYVFLSGTPVTQADERLNRGYHRDRVVSRASGPPASQDKVLSGLLSGQPMDQQERQQRSDEFRDVLMKRAPNATFEKLLNAAMELAIEALPTYRDEQTSNYAKARDILGPDRVAELEKLGEGPAPARVRRGRRGDADDAN